MTEECMLCGGERDIKDGHVRAQEWVARILTEKILDTAWTTLGAVFFRVSKEMARQLEIDESGKAPDSAAAVAGLLSLIHEDLVRRNPPVAASDNPTYRVLADALCHVSSSQVVKALDQCRIERERWEDVGDSQPAIDSIAAIEIALGGAIR